MTVPLFFDPWSELARIRADDARLSPPSTTLYEHEPEANSLNLNKKDPTLAALASLADPHGSNRVAIPSPECTTNDWREIYEERIAVATIDGEQSESEARRIAHQYCVVRWLDLHPIISAADRCAGCGKADRPGNIVPFGTKPPGHAWLHPGCWADWHASRCAEAITALAGFRITRGDET